jgi:hypothetical protein
MNILFSQKNSVFVKWCLFTIISILFLSVSFFSEGYDDEFYNIRYVREMSFFDMIRFMQHEDLHPPLSYIINYILFQILHDWSLVRLCSALFFLAALWYLLKKTENRAQHWAILLLLGLNPSLMLWATGLRWYAYMVPVLLMLTAMPQPDKKYYWAWFFGWLLIAAYLGYAALFLAIPYFLCYWINDKTPFKDKWKKVLPWALSFGILYAYQAYIFLTVHSKMNMTQTANQQVFDLKSTLIAYLSSVFANQGLFPVSFFGLISILAMGILFLNTCFNFKKTNQEKHWLVFLLSSIVFLITGIGGKVRNLILLEPSKTIVLSKLWSNPSKWVIVGFCLLLIGNLAGVYNVLAHQNTTKNAWNLPVKKTIAELEKYKDINAEEIFFTHHPSFTYYLTIQNKLAISFYTSLYFNKSETYTSLDKLHKYPSKRKNFIFLINYKGRSIEPDHYDSLRASLKTIQCDSVVHLKFDKDSEYNIRKRFFPDYPEYQTEVFKLYNVKGNYNALKVWEMNSLQVTNNEK